MALSAASAGADAAATQKAMVATQQGEGKIFRAGESCHRGIPEAIFIENVHELCTGQPATMVVTQLQELYNKYQYMQSSLTSQRSGLRTKLPDISQALETVRQLIKRRDASETAEVTYQLSETIYTRAEVPPSDKVCLWLGANVMLEYTLDEAVELLGTNEANAKSTLKSLDEDTAFLRDQITTTEVNIARVHNYNVKLRQTLKEQQAAGELPTPSAPAAAAAPKAGAAAGGITWRQTAEEMEVAVPLPEGSKKEDVKVTILVDSLRVEHAGKVIVEGELGGKCSPNGSTWTMNNGRVEVSLEKVDSAVWPNIFVTPE
eukprot:gnl/TRDRNA2_/TRDRNA2_185876_c0_seq1.p1 gnl/TRDRNA2_/TRDRNA2_185876_c0~~gnl/TRDRNA2_/TRDRNA2_185876_c0_seq1.p1  ORF type:complete len:318 (+),score=76.32 gnl/TRDRNA2_/TRDRNA2_185876_c0_seq1:49-1002(+)